MKSSRFFLPFLSVWNVNAFRSEKVIYCHLDAMHQRSEEEENPQRDALIRKKFSHSVGCLELYYILITLRYARLEFIERKMCSTYHNLIMVSPIFSLHFVCLLKHPSKRLKLPLVIQHSPRINKNDSSERLRTIIAFSPPSAFCWWKRANLFYEDSQILLWFNFDIVCLSFQAHLTWHENSIR